ncbi:MAG: T9SS type A sorting domain-containing protein [Chitinophagaceae bacterium]|nr:T9SS type A sorting domain-containing protein [Chitinophagaceae bacterium]
MAIDKIITLIILIFFGNNLYAQTCSVNAGVPSRACVSADSFILTGNATGALSTTPGWSLVSGPNVPVITAPGSATTSVKGIVSGTYIFRYAATCSDAVVADDSVTVTVDALPVFTAGRDTFVCGSTATMKATLPAGASGIWTYVPVTSSISSINIGSPGSPTSNFSVSGYNASCPKSAYAIWTVTQGACTSRDTAIASFGLQGSMPVVADQVICGTSYTTPYYYYGCGGNLNVKQLSGPTTATISYTSTGYSNVNISSMTSGMYTFSVAATACSGTVLRDTFNITVASTVDASNPSYTWLALCPSQFDSVYYFEPASALLPGETLSWALTPSSVFPGGLPNPLADTIGNVLRLRNVQHPDSTSATGYYDYYYPYTVSNGTCTRTSSVRLRLYVPLTEKSFIPVLNLACGTTSGNIAQLSSGSLGGITFTDAKIITKPAGTPDPVFTTSGSGVNASGLQPGKYVVSFAYYKGTTGCAIKTASVEVNVSAPAGLSNAGSPQVLPCGIDSSVLAGNVPPAGQRGNWELVSGPSTVVLTNPSAASLVIKNLLPGVYKFRWTIANGITCPATSDEMEVIVTSMPPFVTAGPDRTVCYGYSVPLRGTAGSTGSISRWRQIAGPSLVIADTTAAATSVSGTVASSVYTLTYSLTNACGSDTDTLVITTTGAPGPSDARITTADQCITVSSTTLNATAPTVGTGLWTQLSGPTAATIDNPAGSTTNVTGLSGGVYQFIWSVMQAGCDTLRDTVSVAYRTASLVANAGTDRYICKDSVHLNATAPAIGYGSWTQAAGPPATITDPAAAATAVTGLQPGAIYDFTWTVRLGACPQATDEVHVVVSAPPSAAKAMKDTTICNVLLPVGSQLLLPLNADTPASGTGSWNVLQAPLGYGSPGIANPGAAHTRISMTGGSYLLLWKVSNGVCPVSYDTVSIELVPRADAGAASYNLCERISYNLRGTSPGTGTVRWSQLSGPGTATITNPDNESTTVTNMLAGGVYQFQYEVLHPASGCSSADTVALNNAIRIPAHAGRDTVFCWKPGGTTLVLQADTPSSGSGTWARSSGTGTLSYSPNANSNPTRATVSDAGLHQFRWTVSNGACQSVDYKDVLVEQLTVPPINVTPLTSCKDSLTVDVNSPYSNFHYAWSFQRARIRDTAGTNLTGPIANNFLAQDTNTVFLTITNPATGCQARDSTAIIVNCAYLPLPLTLLSFDAYKKGQKVLLEWETAAEQNISKYTVERSADGIGWQQLGQQPAAGSPDLKQQYRFTDAQALAGINLYRLRIEEHDMSYRYSSSRQVNMDAGETGLLVYPNPASRAINMAWNTGGAVSYVLTDALGRELLQGKLMPGAAHQIDVSTVAEGFYLLKVSSESIGTRTHKVHIVR